MRLFLFLMLMFFPFAAAGQKLNGPASLAEGESSEFYYDVDDQYRYLAYEFAVPAGSIGFIGLRRLSGDAVATDVIIREIMVAFEKEIGGSRFVIAMARNLFKSLAATAADAQC